MFCVYSHFFQLPTNSSINELTAKQEVCRNMLIKQHTFFSFVLPDIIMVRNDSQPLYILIQSTSSILKSLAHAHITYLQPLNEQKQTITHPYSITSQQHLYKSLDVPPPPCTLPLGAPYTPSPRGLPHPFVIN